MRRISVGIDIAKDIHWVGLSVISCGAGIVGWKETPHAATQTARNRRRAA